MCVDFISQSDCLQCARASNGSDENGKDRLHVKLSAARVAILIVEDELPMARFLEKHLGERFSIVDCVTTCAGALDAVRERSYDLVILDDGLPDGSGIELLRRWRQEGCGELILVISDRHGLEDCVKGLDAGADGYLTKPFVLDELMARVHSLLRRQEATRRTLFEHRGLTLDASRHTVHFGEHRLELTGREYALLEVFIQNPGRILSRSLICERIWEADHGADANLLDVYMSRLRSKLQRSSGKSFFRTVRGIGYQFD